MRKNLAYKIMDWLGWTIKNDIELPKKYIICLAPHTTNWDFVYGLLFKSAIRLKANFFMKKEWFRFPMGNFMRSLGGIPIDRGKKTKITDLIAAEFDKHDELCIGITPEGTRSKTKNWKRGFYTIAEKTNVPIVLTYIDYKTKNVGFAKIYTISGDFDKDIVEIKKFFSQFSGKHPDRFDY